VRVAAVDIGTNSTRLLVADVADGQVSEVERKSIVTRLGHRVDHTGRLDAEACQRVLAALHEYRERIEALGAQRVTAVATSAVRDTANGPAFRNRVATETGIEARVIDGAQEATLTFAGAAYGGAHRDEPTVVIDIGGGSTEYVVGADSELTFHTSTQIGAVRQSERHLRSDPPTAGELEALAGEVRELVCDAVPSQVRETVVRAVAVAGTPTSLAAVDLELEQFDPWKVHGHVLSLDRLEELLAMLAPLPLKQRQQVVGLHRDRAVTIVAGAVVLVQSLRCFEVETVEVSEHDILYGMVLRAAGEEPAGG
jgi:exopolyphosphatase/guanosine-5'-triphosphate,3'-diphosphate pyrophosphatase